MPSFTPTSPVDLLGAFLLTSPLHPTHRDEKEKGERDCVKKVIK